MRQWRVRSLADEVCQGPFLLFHWTSEPCLGKSRGEAASFPEMACQGRFFRMSL